MSRYVNPTGLEAQYEPGSGKRVLKNKLGIRRKTEMDQTELEALIRAQRAYYELPDLSARRIDSEFICDMHRDWLGEIYEWAGHYRTVELSKNEFVWPPAYLVHENMVRFENEILTVHTPCRPGVLHEVCRSIATVHAELLLIHPFREGNGRIARWLSDIMAYQAGYVPPLYRFTGKGSRRVREEYLSAVVQGYAQNYEPLARFFEDAVLAR